MLCAKKSVKIFVVRITCSCQKKYQGPFQYKTIFLGIEIYITKIRFSWEHIDGLGQERRNSIANALGAVSIRKTVLPGMAIPMLKIRRPNGRLIFNMEIAICR